MSGENHTKSKRYWIRIQSSVTLTFRSQHLFQARHNMFGAQQFFGYRFGYPNMACFFFCTLHTDFWLAIESTFMWVLPFNHDTPRTNESNDLGKIPSWFAWQEWNAFCEMRHPLYSKFIEAGGWAPWLVAWEFLFLKTNRFLGKVCLVHFRDVFLECLLLKQFWFDAMRSCDCIYSLD